MPNANLRPFSGIKQQYPSIRGTGSSRFTISRANLVVPQDVDRSAYILQCLSTGTISVKDAVSGGTTIHNVPVDRVTINYLDFPESSEQLGTPVLLANEPLHNQPICIGAYRFDNESLNDIEENQWKMRQFDAKGNLAEVTGLANNTAAVLITAAGSNAGSGNIQIVATNPTGDSSTIIETGSAEIQAGKTITLKAVQKLTLQVFDLNNGSEATQLSLSNGGFSYQDGNGVKVVVQNGELSYSDENNTIEATKKGVKIDGLRVNFGSGNEPLVLGNKVVSLLNSLINQIASMTFISVAPGSPTSPPVNAPQIAAIAGQLQTILSTKTNTQ